MKCAPWLLCWAPEKLGSGFTQTGDTVVVRATAAPMSNAVVEGWLQRAPAAIRNASLRAQLEYVVVRSREGVE